MKSERAQIQLIANALHEIRLLLSSYVGSQNDAPADVRMAAHLAYALHCEALAISHEKGFDVAVALRKVAAIDDILHVSDGTRLAEEWSRPRNPD